MEELNKIYDYLIEEVGIPREVIDVITSINGYKKKTFDDLIYYYTSFNDYEQLREEYQKE